MNYFRSALVLAMAAISAAGASDAPYVGKWRLNPSKSQFTNDTVTFEKTPSGDYRFEERGFIYYFKLDGKEYPMPDGGATSWKATSADTWECTNRSKGKINATFKLTLKGDAITSVATIPEPGGKDITETSTAKRVSGGPGFIGVWKATEVKAAATGLELTANGADGLVMKYPEFKSQCVGKFDGKPYPMTGAGDAEKTAMAFRKTGAASFEATTLIDGKPYSIDTFTVSADGKVLTDDGISTAKKESTKTVYDRE